MLLAEVNEITHPRLPTVGQIRDYLEAEGWSARPPGPAGSMWVRNRDRIGIPDLDGEDPLLVQGILERLARAERKDLRFVTNYIRYYRTDVTLLQAASEQAASETIPLGAASTVLNSARSILRASGTTAWSERGHIDGNYARQGDAVLDRARMDHTIHGPFMIPVLVPIPRLQHSLDQQRSSESLELFRAAPEPFERRVTRTLAQALLAVQEVIVQPEHMPTMRDLHQAIDRGVSREFCTALSKILEEPSIGEFKAQFEWAPAVSAPETMPKSIGLPSEAREKIDQAAEILKRSRSEARSIFSGGIVELRHVLDDPWGYITIATVRQGRACEIRVRLRYPQYQEAMSWHSKHRAVIVEGAVREGPNRRLVVDEPVSCRPIDEALLPSGDGSADVIPRPRRR
ncbi:hypothetical protein ACFRJ3_22090 [Streptomyces sp. NPDC056696]|uniref:hypothetical protein n=1 Tax=Streptomyces sp. NPDC056696 TaxID=3345914 RepID=UPI0036BB0BCD